MKAPKFYCMSRVLSLMLVLYCDFAISRPFGEYSDTCDWEGSGLRKYEDRSSRSERVVVPVYLRCLEGTVKWLYPRRGLRVILRHGTSSDSEFRGCIKVASNVSSSVRIFIEGHQALHKLYSHGDGMHPGLERCFVSNGGQAALYLETEGVTKASGQRDVFEFSYHLVPVSSQRSLHEKNTDCAPCTDFELISSYCSSHFILYGTVSSMYDNKPLDRSELTIKAKRVVKDVYVVDKEPMTKWTGAGQGSAINGTAVDRYLVLHRPLKCHSKAGQGSEFLFLGHWVLGSPVIRCAPKISYWKHVKSRAIESGANQCQLN